MYVFQKKIFRSCKSTVGAMYDTFENVLFFEQSASVLSETYFTFFSTKVPRNVLILFLARTFYNVRLSC